MQKKQYLLILACSQRKLSNKELLPAIERYDGGSYRVIKKAIREQKSLENLGILILSAKYGLINASTLIHDYEQRIDRDRAIDLKDEVQRNLRKYANTRNFAEIYIDLSLDYKLAIEGIQDIFPRSHFVFAKGRIGERLRQLKLWLEEKSMD